MTSLVSLVIFAPPPLKIRLIPCCFDVNIPFFWLFFLKPHNLISYFRQYVALRWCFYCIYNIFSELIFLNCTLFDFRLIGSCINYGFHHYPIGGHLAIVHSAQSEAVGGIKSTEIWLWLSPLIASSHPPCRFFFEVGKNYMSFVSTYVLCSLDKSKWEILC